MRSTTTSSRRKSSATAAPSRRRAASCSSPDRWRRLPSRPWNLQPPPQAGSDRPRIHQQATQERLDAIGAFFVSCSAPRSSIMRPMLQANRVRYGVLGFACALSMITYLDRVCFGTVAPFIQREFGLSETQKGWLFTAFAFSYAIFEVPTGWLGDVFGPRK